ncbi:MAG TPA: VWA domain-containing protein [Thermoanaerobaculia bacterium]
MRPVILSLLILSFSAILNAQTFEEKLTVNYVEIPVTVTTRDGNPVRGLTRESFEVVEGGQRREIESFEAIDFASATERSPRAVSPLNPSARRNFLLVFDLSFANPGSIGRAQIAARDFVTRSVGDRDRVGVATLDAERGFRFLTAFTTDRNALMAAIADPHRFRAFDPLLIAGQPLEQVTPASGDAGSLGGRGDPAMEIAADFARMERAQQDAAQRLRVRRQLETLGAAARSLQRLAGRKHVVLLSEGFSARLVQGRSAAESREQHDENAALQYGEVWKVDSDARFGSTSAQTSLAMMATQFRRSDVVLHAIDIQGVRVRNEVRGGANANSNDGLFLLANATGGTVFQNSNDIGAELERFSRQHEVVYVLGFRAPAGQAGEFRDVRVRIAGVQGARVQHRSGYYAQGGETDLERSLSAAEVILNDIPQDEIALASLVAAFPSDDSAAIVPVILEISGPDLIRHARGGVTTTDIFVYAFDSDGLVRGSIHQRLRMDLAKTGDQLAGGGVRFYGTLRLPPGQYAVKSLVSSSDEKRGFRRDDLTVPAIDEIAIVQPLFFEEAGHWIMVKATSDTAGTPYPFLHEGEPFIPAVRPSLRRGEPRLFTVFVYNSDAEELEWEITPAAKPVSVKTEEFMSRYLFALESFSPDLERVDVTIRKKGSSDARSTGTAVEVR